MSVELDAKLAEAFVSASSLNDEISRGRGFAEGLLNDPKADPGVKGWLRCDGAAMRLDAIKAKAAEIRADADVFVLVGVGGSNQAARAVIEALPKTGGPKVVYAGNTLSPAYLRGVLAELEGKSVYVDVIAKNFETLEPGSHYRVLRAFMRDRCSRTELARRFVLTGSRGSLLEDIARENGHEFFDFPPAIGGRYSAFSPVALLPLAAAGLDIDAYLQGGSDMERRLSKLAGDNPAVRYAALRNLLFRKGFLVEMLASFEPRLSYFGKWWWQLFGESEGKNGTGIFPSFASYSEDLHSIGQYMQDGNRILAETFLSVGDSGASLVVESDPEVSDRFDYLNGKDFADINRAAESATMEAHAAGGIPCIRLQADRLDEYHFGQLFYFFMFSCAVSGKLLGVNPFDQDGVERYKMSMFKALGKPSAG